MHARVLLAFAALAAIGFGQELETAEKLFWDQDFTQAEQVLRDLVAKESEDVANARYRLAMTLLELEKVPEAQQEIAAATEAGLPEGKVSLARGRLAMANKQFPEAQALLTVAIEADFEDEAGTEDAADPVDAEAYYYRGLAYAATNDFQSAVPDFDKSIELRPGNFMAHYYAGIACNRIRRPDQMVAHFEQLIKLAPNSEQAQRAQSLLRSVR